jgi:response regulator RpfG family c-di-GMP phosphodiesterase
MTAPARVLCVDDEPMVLEGLERNLGEAFEIVTASSGLDGLALIAASPPFAAIVSDMRMPQMTGAEFLAQARRLAPDATRVLLTGYADTSAAIAAINDGHIFRFLCKPCAPDVLQRHLVDAVRHHALVTAERELLEQTLQGAVQLLTDLLALAAPALFERSRQLRARVAFAAEALGYDNRWECELAALLAHVGCVTLPPGLIERAWAGARVTPDERALVDAHPAVAHRLLAAIPRLGRVADIVRLQRGTSRIEDATLARAVDLLRAALALDQLLARRVPLAEALEALTTRHHDPAIVHALGAHAQPAPGTRAVCLADAWVGWVLDRDVMAPTGAMLAKAGMTLSPVLLEALHRFARGAGVVEPIYVRAT